MAILRYVGALDADPTTSETSAKNPLYEPNLSPLTNPAAPGGNGPADIYIDLDFTFDTPNFYVKHYTWTAPTVPVLLQILSGAYTAQQLLPEGSVYVLPPNKTIQISMPGGVAGVHHPLHLHGHSFSVIRSAGETEVNLVNPVRRDTVNIGLQGDNVTIRYTTDNAGPWFIHCHIDFHLNAGFGVVMTEDTESIASTDSVTPAWDQLCPDYDALSVTDL